MLRIRKFAAQIEHQIHPDVSVTINNHSLEFVLHEKLPVLSPNLSRIKPSLNKLHGGFHSAPPPFEGAGDEKHRCVMVDEIVQSLGEPHKPTSKQARHISDIIAKMPEPMRTNAQKEKSLAWGDDNKASPEEVATYFFKNYEAIWTKWVPADVAEKVKASL